MSQANRPLAYRMGPFDPAHGDMRNAAHLTCEDCGTVGKLPVVHMGNNPEWIEKMFIRLNWDADVHKPKQCFCPKCVRLRKIRKDIEVPQPARPPKALVHVAQHFGLGSGTRSTPKENDVTMKDLTPAQKTALRNELGGTFDEGAGRYLEGNSDHLVSEKTGVPRAVVVEFREAFFGPLQEDPEIAAFKQQLAEAHKFAKNFEVSLKRLDDLAAKISRKVGL